MTAVAAGGGRMTSVVTAVVLGLAVGVATTVLVQLAPVLPVALAAVAALGASLARRPGAAVAVALGAVVLLDGDRQGFLPATAVFYEPLPVVRLRPAEIVLALAATAVVGDLAARRAGLRLPGPFVWPLALVALAVAAGSVVGWTGGADPFVLFYAVLTLAWLLVVPLVVLQVLPDASAVRRAAAVAGGLAVAKGAQGTVAWLLGYGRPVADTHLAFYGPTANWLLVAFLLCTIALVLAGRAPRWVLFGWPLALAAFVLSFRRSFWIAAAVGAVLCVLAASGRRGRVFAVPAVLALMGGAWLTFTSAGTTNPENPVLERVQSLRPSSLTRTSEDRYRLDEQRNVIAELRHAPLVGLGLGVPWDARSPLPEEHPGGRDYVHIAVLWYWLKLGLAGAVAYIWLIVGAIVTAARVWRRFPDADLRPLGLGLACAIVALAVAETTGTFVGVDLRFTMLFGAVLAWLAAATACAVEAGDG